MKRIVLYLLISLATTSFVACSDDNDHNDSKQPTTYRRSLLVYMMAQNSLGSAGAQRLDSTEIMQGMTQLKNENDNVFVFIDDARLPRLYRLYRYRNRTIVDKVQTWQQDLCSTDPQTLSEVLSFVKDNYPSLSYGLVMWSHGNGWLPSSQITNTLKGTARSIGIDVGPGGNMSSDRDVNGRTGTQMEISDMAKAIQQSGIHLDYIFFDACLMQCIEVAYELRHTTDYVVGSAVSTSAYGGYYFNLLPKALMAYPANDENISLIASQYYYDTVENPNLQKYYDGVGSVISVIKCAELDSLATLSSKYLNNVKNTEFTPQFENIQPYSDPQYFSTPHFYDMGSAMHALLPPQDYQLWQEQALRTVIYHRASSKFLVGYTGVFGSFAVENDLIDEANVLGVSMFVPQKKYNSPYSTPYNKQIQSTAWWQRVWQ